MSWLNSLEHFVAVVDAGSFNKAAANLSTTPSAVSKRVTWLEDAVKKRLILRTTRSLTLTKAGQELYENGRTLLDEWRSLKTKFTNEEEELQGELRLGIPRWSCDRFITDQVGIFLKKYPKLKIRVIVGHDFHSPLEEKLDIIFADEMYGKKYDHLIRKRLFTMHRRIYAAPSFLKDKPKIKTLKDCEKYNSLSREQAGSVLEFNGEKITLSSNIACNDGDTLAKLAVQGLGIFYSSPVILVDKIKSGKLIRILPNYESKSVNFYAYYSKTRYVPKQIPAFINALAEVFKKVEMEIS